MNFDWEVSYTNLSAKTSLGILSLRLPLHPLPPTPNLSLCIHYHSQPGGRTNFPSVWCKYGIVRGGFMIAAGTVRCHWQHCRAPPARPAAMQVSALGSNDRVTRDEIPTVQTRKCNRLISIIVAPTPRVYKKYGCY